MTRASASILAIARVSTVNSMGPLFFQMRADRIPMAQDSQIRNLRMVSSAMPVFGHGFAYFAFGFLIFFRLAAIPFLFTLREGNFAFGSAVSKVDFEWYNRQTLLIRL